MKILFYINGFKPTEHNLEHAKKLRAKVMQELVKKGDDRASDNLTLAYRNASKVSSGDKPEVKDVMVVTGHIPNNYTEDVCKAANITVVAYKPKEEEE